MEITCTKRDLNQSELDFISKTHSLEQVLLDGFTTYFFHAINQDAKSSEPILIFRFSN